MVSRRKRSSYVTESEYSSDEDMDYVPVNNKRKRALSHMKVTTEVLPTSTIPQNDVFGNSKVKEEFCEEMSNQDGENRRAKCTSRNAVIARKNRIRKKMYIQNLENEVTKLRNSREKLNSVVSNQSFLISELRKEIKYMKSVLANSSDISNLIKNIRNSTGMSVTTSLDKTLTMNNNCVSKHKTTVARKTAHPWEDYNISTPEADVPVASSKTDSNEDFDLSSGFTDLDIPLDVDIPFSDFPFNLDEIETPHLSFETLEENNYQDDSHSKVIEGASTFKNTWDEHNYTTALASKYSGDEDNVGVCLHVSQHKVSLEFCSSCNENAMRTWKELE